MAAKETFFSKAELLLLLGIITAFLSILIPWQQNAKVRASQAEAKAELIALYQAQAAFHKTYGTYHWDLPMIGFLPYGLSADDYGTGLVGSRRRYVLYAGYSGKVDPVTAAAELKLQPTEEKLYRPNFGYGADSDLCPLAAKGARQQIIEVLYGSNPEVQKKHFTAVALGCPVRVAEMKAKVEAQISEAKRSLDLIAISEKSSFRQINSAE